MVNTTNDIEDDIEDEDDLNLNGVGNPWEIRIRKAKNGFILTSYEDNSDGDGVRKNETIVEDKKEEHDEKGEHISYDHHEEYNEAATMSAVFGEVGEFFGYYGSKHDTYRLRIIIEKQFIDDKDLL